MKGKRREEKRGEERGGFPLEIRARGFTSRWRLVAAEIEAAVRQLYADVPSVPRYTGYRCREVLSVETAFHPPLWQSSHRELL